MSTQLKPLTRDAVRSAARCIIELNGQTTNLETKNLLRSQGFWVTQDEVREFMLDITSGDGDIEYIDNGQFRTYRFKSNTTTLPPGWTLANGQTTGVLPSGWTLVGGNVNTSIPESKIDVTDQVVVKKKKNNDNVPANYIVTDQNGHYRCRYNSVTRGQAKHYWAVDMNMPYDRARTQRVV